MKFFFDRCLSVHLAHMIACFDRENNIVHQDDDSRFTATSLDVEIIRELSLESPRPVWITNDVSQKSNPEERAALRDSGMTIFFFRRNNLAIHFQALKSLAIWPEIARLAATVRVPTAFSIPGGRIGAINTKIDRLGNTAELFRRT